MLEVTKVTSDGGEFLKCKLLKMDPKVIGVIKSIKGWFQGKEPMTYGVPGDMVKELHQKTVNYLVIWKGSGDSMGSLVKGIDTSEIPEDYIVDYTPKLPLRPYQVKAFNLLMSRDKMLIADQEGVGKLYSC